MYGIWYIVWVFVRVGRIILRRGGCLYIINLYYGAPQEDQWKEIDLVRTVMQNLFIPDGGNYYRVLKV
jgi:hypothetical protein